IRLGLDLEPYRLEGEERAARRAAKREEWGIDSTALVVTLVARLVPIKRVDRFLRIAARLAEADASIRFVIVGDGQLRERLRASREAVSVRERLHWAGFDRDMPG